MYISKTNPIEGINTEQF